VRGVALCRKWKSGAPFPDLPPADRSDERPRHPLLGLPVTGDRRQAVARSDGILLSLF
jgi:hypothetical protein